MFKDYYMRSLYGYKRRVNSHVDSKLGWFSLKYITILMFFMYTYIAISTFFPVHCISMLVHVRCVVYSLPFKLQFQHYFMCMYIVISILFHVHFSLYIILSV